jgi:hypothetical protein
MDNCFCQANIWSTIFSLYKDCSDISEIMFAKKYYIHVGNAQQSAPIGQRAPMVTMSQHTRRTTICRTRVSPIYQRQDGGTHLSTPSSPMNPIPARGVLGEDAMVHDDRRSGTTLEDDGGSESIFPNPATFKVANRGGRQARRWGWSPGGLGP